jgi:hypothetical protein
MAVRGVGHIGTDAETFRTVKKLPRHGGCRCHPFSDKALSQTPNGRSSLDHAHHAQDLIDDEEEEAENCPDEVLCGGFD